MPLVVDYDFAAPSDGARRAGIDHVPDGVSLIRQLSVGDAVHLVREPDNAHDKNAVAVFNFAGQRLGYIPRKVSADLARAIDEDDAQVSAIVAEKIATGRDRKRFNALLEIRQVRRRRRRSRKGAQ